MTPQPAKPRVLIVDDHPANRRAFESLLEEGYTLGVAATGHQALELTLRDDYAVILMDVRMPGMDGFEVADLLRKRERTRHTPIVFISAFDQTVLQLKKGYVAGATDFIFSPVDEELLKLKVQTYVQIYLRNEALRLKIHELERTLGLLHAEFDRLDPSRTVLNQRIKDLESTVLVMKLELNAVRT
jgi:CheY-like chemotaxis protein